MTDKDTPQEWKAEEQTILQCDMRRLCEQRLEGARGSLWQEPRNPQTRKQEPESDDNATDPHDCASDF